MSDRDLISTVAVLEKEAVDQMKNKLNAAMYRETRAILRDEGLDEAAVVRIAARIALRAKRMVQEV